MAASEVHSYTATNLSYPDLQFDVHHAKIKVMCDSSKSRADTKEDTAITCPNAGITAHTNESYSPNDPL